MSINEIQPAIKSYFFGKGYRDLWNTIAESWKLNLGSAKSFWVTASRRWNNGSFEILAAIAMAFAALSVVLFGTLWFGILSAVHIVILAIFFSIIYLLFSFFWIIERIYMLWHGVFVVCPICHEKYDLPHYQCPNCSVIHTRLIPNSYGILKRTCQCGEKLPTTFYNGRNKLTAKCPNEHCARTLETGVAKPICIPIIGGPSVGKTCFLSAATRELIENVATRNSWKIRFLNSQNADMYARVAEDFENGVLPAKTVERTPTAFNFFVGSSKWSPEKLMYFYDSAGEAFHDTDDLVSHKFYGYLHGFLFVIDPFSIPELLEEYEDNLKIYGRQIKPSDLMLEDCFDTMLVNLEKNHDIKLEQRINKPCAVVINKIDAFDLEDRIGENAIRQFLMQNSEIKDPDKASKILCERFFKECGLESFLRKLEQKFKNYRFFPSSALGRIPEDKDVAFKPYGVKEPLMWLLGQADRKLKVD